MKLLLFLTVCASALVITTGALAAAPQPAPDPFGSRTAEPLVVQRLRRRRHAARRAGGIPPGVRSDHGGTSPNASARAAPASTPAGRRPSARVGTRARAATTRTTTRSGAVTAPGSPMPTSAATGSRSRCGTPPTAKPARGSTAVCRLYEHSLLALRQLLLASADPAGEPLDRLSRRLAPGIRLGRIRIANGAGEEASPSPRRKRTP